MVRSEGYSSVGDNGERLHLDAADTLAVDDGHLDVSLVTPDGVPGVLDEPVFLAALGAVADSEDGVVEVGSASSGGHDTGLVGLEDVRVGLNGDSERLGGESGLHLCDVVGGHESVAGDINSGGGTGVVLAAAGRTVSGGVGVDRLELSIAGLVVLESLVLPATVATVVSGGALNELLLGEGEEVAGGNLVSTFDGTSGGERPA